MRRRLQCGVSVPLLPCQAWQRRFGRSPWAGPWEPCGICFPWSTTSTLAPGSCQRSCLSLWLRYTADSHHTLIGDIVSMSFFSLLYLPDYLKSHLGMWMTSFPVCLGSVMVWMLALFVMFWNKLQISCSVVLGEVSENWTLKLQPFPCIFCWPKEVPVQCGLCGASPGSLSLN